MLDFQIVCFLLRKLVVGMLVMYSDLAHFMTWL